MKRMNNIINNTNSKEETVTIILPPTHYHFLWRISWLSLISCAFAVYRGHYDLAFVPGGVWVTSINYWRKPDYSWRRHVDVIYVHLGMIYQILRALEAGNRNYYYTVLFLAMIFFSLGVHYYKQKHLWSSTISHGMVHVFGNVSNVILYYGDIPVFNDCWFMRKCFL